MPSCFYCKYTYIYCIQPNTAVITINKVAIIVQSLLAIFRFGRTDYMYYCTVWCSYLYCS